MANKILIVDDNPDIVFMIQDTLSKQGFEVASAAEGSEALRTLKTFVPDLMIVDLTMPIMSGWQFTMKVRQNPRFKKTPIIVLSALLDRDAEPEKYEAANAYMVKPFDIFKLVDKVKELLKHGEEN